MRLYVKTTDKEGQVATLLDSDVMEGEVEWEPLMDEVPKLDAKGMPEVNKKGELLYDKRQTGVVIWINA